MGSISFTVHKLSSKEERRSLDSNPGLLDEKCERYLCAMLKFLYKKIVYCNMQQAIIQNR